MLVHMLSIGLFHWYMSVYDTTATRNIISIPAPPSFLGPGPCFIPAAAPHLEGFLGCWLAVSGDAAIDAAASAPAVSGSAAVANLDCVFVPVGDWDPVLATPTEKLGSTTESEPKPPNKGLSEAPCSSLQTYL